MASYIGRCVVLCAGLLAAAPAGAAEIRPALMRGVKPGVSTRAEAEAALGPPQQVEGDAAEATLVYDMPPFAHVDLLIEDDRVAAIVLHNAEPQDVAEVTKELALMDVEPALVTDAEGVEVGLAFPERGVMFVFAGQDRRVAQVVLESIQAEPFILRAEQVFRTAYQAALTDLELAEKYDADEPRIYFLRAAINAEIGQPSQGLEAVRRGLELEPNNPQLHFQQARLLAAKGDRAAALQAMEAAPQEAAGSWAAFGHYQRGELLIEEPGRDCQQALSEYQQAIQLAAKLAAGDDPQAKQLGERLLFEANLGAACAVGLGNWQGKRDAAYKWTKLAFEQGEKLVAAEPRLQLYACRRALHAMSGIEGIDPASLVAESQRAHEEALQDNNDPLFCQAMNWELGLALVYAAEVQRHEKRWEQCARLLSQAAPLLEQAGEQREPTPARNLVLGELYCLQGALEAIHKNNHLKAVSCYDKALLLLEPAGADTPLGEPAMHGQRLVSMGVSYWHNGAHQQALELTQAGVKLLEQAVEDGAAGKQALVIPYGNLAAMNRKLGREQDAENMAQRAAYFEEAK